MHPDTKKILTSIMKMYPIITETMNHGIWLNTIIKYVPDLPYTQHLANCLAF